MGESPLFFALGKIKHNQAEKIKMVKLLLESDRIDIGIVNNEKKASYEVYNDQFGLDEAASIVEKLHLKGKDESEKRGSRLFFRDFTPLQRATIMNKSVSTNEKV
jgi:hypothetical protein